MTNRNLPPKARKAIDMYISILSENPTLEHISTAVRMPRSKLYKLLKEEGYHWNPTLGMWVMKQVKS